MHEQVSDDFNDDARAMGWRLRAVLLLVAIVAIAGPIAIVATTPPAAPKTVKSVDVRPKHVVPKATLPDVEPFRVQELSPDQARAYNASIPFVSGSIIPARAFHLYGGTEDRARALDCLATAILYEAGDDTTGEKAVAQVVLNRVRHPAFPNTVCGVVFQGAERSTGCQFTFTCDGSLARTYSDEAWERARTVARNALSGTVDKAVGNATHYHTDWVVPYWSASLDKIARVETHLFFRWTGWWGTPPAFAMHYAGNEPRVGELSRLFEAHKTDDELASANFGTVDAATVAPAEVPTHLTSDPDIFLVTLDPKLDPATLTALAAKACGERDYCKFLAWTDAAKTPAGLPLESQAISTMAFSYLRDIQRRYEKALWNCDVFPRSDDGQCMHRRARPAPKVDENFTLESLPGSTTTAVPEPLDGVRRKTGTLTPARSGDASGG